MKKALLGAPTAVVVALAPLWISSAQARADDPCVSITDPAAHQACIDHWVRDQPMERNQGNCQASPRYGALGQFCRNSWIREAPPLNEEWVSAWD